MVIFERNFNFRLIINQKTYQNHNVLKDMWPWYKEMLATLEVALVVDN